MSLVVLKEDIYLTFPEIYLTEKLSNKDLLKKLNIERGLKSKEQWITSRSGIESRHWAKDEETTSMLAIESAKKSIEKYPKFEIEQIILATISGDYFGPPTSPLIQKELNLKNIGCYDLSAACAAFATALYPAVSQALLSGGKQLLICSDIRSKFLNPEDLSTAILFGDAAASTIISKEQSKNCFKVKALSQKANGEHHSLIRIPSGGSAKPAALEENKNNFYLTMEAGASVFISALEAMTTLVKEILEKLNLEASDIDYFVPHQANIHMIDKLAENIGIEENKVIKTIKNTGNLSGASSIVALASLDRKKLKRGELVLNVSAGGGGVAAACVLEVA